jgi:hypothetical protein
MYKAISFLKKPVALIIAAVILLILGAWLVNAVTGGKVAATLARLQGNRADAALESGQDAVNTVGGQQASEAAIDATTRENESDIRKAEGADVPVGTGVNDAGLRSLCKRAAYRDSKQCLQFAAPR